MIICESRRNEVVSCIYLLSILRQGMGRLYLFGIKVEQKLHHTIEYNALISNSEVATREFIAEQRQANNITAVALIGGDGTASSVIQEIAGTDIAIAILPAGSGNDTARTFRLTANPDSFIKGLLEHRTTTIDLLKVNGRYGITVVGVGIDATIGDRVNRSFYKPILNKLGLGSFSYTIAAVFTLLTFKSFNAIVTIDEKKYKMDYAWLTAIGNTSTYGGGLAICPVALPTDGILNITMLHGLRRMTVLFRSFPSLLQGRPVQGKGVSYKTGKEVFIQADRPIPAVIDGEIIKSTPIRIGIHEKAMTLILTIK